MENFSLGEAPRGYIPRVEPHPEQLEFIRKETGISAVMLDLHHATTLLNRGETASHIFPGRTVVTTSTIQDSKLQRLHWEAELDIVRLFGPRWHIPCDWPVYLSDSERVRSWSIGQMVTTTIRMSEALSGTGTSLLPLLKGVTISEWRQCFTPLEEAGFRGFAYYGAQYFGRGRGNRRREIVSDVWSMVQELPIEYLMMVGVQSESVIPRMPVCVRAYAGQGWRAASGVGRVSPEVARCRLRSWAPFASRKMRSRQSALSTWNCIPRGD